MIKPMTELFFIIKSFEFIIFFIIAREDEDIWSMQEREDIL